MFFVILFFIWFKFDDEVIEIVCLRIGVGFVGIEVVILELVVLVEVEEVGIVK